MLSPSETSNRTVSAQNGPLVRRVDIIRRCNLSMPLHCNADLL
jgi:hypothetical protein